ncbi:MAG: hypothetical protein AB1529_03285 [Candidatus Micrarchaeota archaeon]
MTSQKLKYGIAAVAVVGAAYLARPSASHEFSKFKEPAGQVTSAPSADMPAPSYSWASRLGEFFNTHSKKSEYSGL